MSIKVSFNFNTGLFDFNIKDCEYFTTVVETLRKKYHCSYNKYTKIWSSKSALNTFSIMEELRDIDTVIISEDDELLIEDLVYQDDPTFKRVKLGLSKELIERHPPVIGKHPNENFQLEAAKKGIIQNKIIYDISMGHGKSYIFCMVYGSLLLQNRIGNCLIICKPEGVENIRLEILKFLDGIITADDIAVVTTANRNIEDYFDKKIIITNYITFRLSGSYYNKLKNKSEAKKPTKPAIDFDKWGKNLFLLLDEPQKINDYKSLQSHFIHLYGQYFERMMLMSGTLGYKFLHYFSSCKLLLPNTLPYSLSEWTSYVAVRGTKFSDYAVKELREEKVKEFKEKVLDKLQVTYRDCIELPEAIDDLIYIQMSDKMKKLYRAFIEKEIDELDRRRSGKVGLPDLKNCFGRLSMFTSDPSLVKGISWKFEDNPKIDIIESLLDQYISDENRKVIIWSNHPTVINKLAEVLKKYKPIVIHGDEKTSVKRQDRNSLVEEFKKSKTQNLLICSYVLATSINIVESTRQIYFDIIPDNDTFNQSKKRIHRIGQKEPVISHYLLFNNSIDIYIWEEVLQSKENVKNTLSSKEELSLEDYKSIFNRSRESYLTYRG